MHSLYPYDAQLCFQYKIRRQISCDANPPKRNSLPIAPYICPGQQILLRKPVSRSSQ